MDKKSLNHNVSILNGAYSVLGQKRAETLFPEKLVKILSDLHTEFEPRRKELLLARKTRQKEFDGGKVPQFENKNSEAASGNWKVSPIPADLKCRRVEITGPVNSAKMVINMLSKNDQGVRADCAMLDFEDSMKPTWKNIVDGYDNAIAAIRGDLSFQDEKNPAKVYKLDVNNMAHVMYRIRGLHLNESNVLINNEKVSGGLLDLATLFFHTTELFLKRNQTPKYYVPKCEHYLEARYWNDLFTAVEKKLNYPVPTLRATFLIETLGGAFQVEEILYEIREHAAGLNVGRWDKMFSDIKVLKNHADKIMEDRATLNMSKPWMENYAKRVVKICHARGAYGMGGMSAFTPGKTPEIREAQTQKVFQDKKNEFDSGHDGCWVSHPYFITYALKAFPKENQLDVKLENFDKYSDLIPNSKGDKTLQGLRTNLRVGIAYLQGWNNGIGCVSWDNLMEDLATLEISRAQTWQWMNNNVLLKEGVKVDKTLVQKIFDEELEKIVEEVKENMKNASEKELQKTLNEFSKAKTDAFTLFTKTELPDFIALDSEIA